MLAGILSILPNRVRTRLAHAAFAGVEQRTPPDGPAGDLRCAIVERFSR
jgi:hypothetical protein